MFLDKAGRGEGQEGEKSELCSPPEDKRGDAPLDKAGRGEGQEGEKSELCSPPEDKNRQRIDN